MGGIGSIWHWLLIGLVVLVLFGGGKLSGLMGDAAKGIKAFKNGLKDDEDDVKVKKPDEEPKA